MSAHVVYVARDVDGAPVYVGCTRNFLRRMSEHRWWSGWYRDAASIDCHHFASFEPAAITEWHLIAELKPRHNVRRSWPVPGMDWLNDPRPVPTHTTTIAPPQGLKRTRRACSQPANP